MVFKKKQTKVPVLEAWPQLLMLLWEVTESLGGEAWLVEVAQWLYAFPILCLSAPLSLVPVSTCSQDLWYSNKART